MPYKVYIVAVIVVLLSLTSISLAQSTVPIYEKAINMPIRSAGGQPLNGDYAQFTNGYIADNFTFPADGSYQFQVLAYGSSLQGVWPTLAVQVDGVTVATATIDSATPIYALLPVSVGQGTHQVALAFTNDAYVPPEDRNLVLRSLAIVPLAAPLILEAEYMSFKSTGGAVVSGDYYAQFTNGSISESVVFGDTGTYQFQVVGYGSPVQNVWPNIALQIDGVTLGSGTLNSSAPMTLTFSGTVNAGGHFVTLVFTNDAYAPPEDRNAVFKSLTISSLQNVAIGSFGQGGDEEFDPLTYVGIYPDLMNVYGQNLDGATSHWSGTGLPREGRRGSIAFDPKYYLQTNSDLAQAYGITNYAAGLQHFMIQGLPAEGRRGSLEFDPQYYLANNPDVQAMVGPGGYLGAMEHFLGQGLPNEGRAGSADFNVSAYVSLYPDVGAAYGATNYEQAALQWLRRGKSQGRAGTGAPAPSTDCAGQNPPSGYTRIFIGATGPFSTSGTGTVSMPLDGSTTQNFDAILRAYSNNPGGGVPSVSNLIVCINAGHYTTEGSYDYVIDIPHTSSHGFALGPNWKVHGNADGKGTTTLQLVNYLAGGSGTAANALGLKAGQAQGSVFSTGSDSTPGVEISDITIDDNYPNLKPMATQQGIAAIDLLAIQLRSDQGGHWIHRVNVINSSGEIGEDFPVWIVSVNNTDFTLDGNNLIEYVTMSNWGAGTCTAITVAGATAEVRNNVVNGFEKGYGGWNMGPVNFHDNFAINNPGYGFNIDSLANNGVSIQFNQIVHPQKYGIVIGGGGTYSNFYMVYNTVSMNSPNVTGLIIQGDVTNATIGRNNLIVESPGGVTPFGLTGILVKGSGNSNIFQFNQIDGSLPVIFQSPSILGQNCVFDNWNQFGSQSSVLPNTTSSPCVQGL